MKKLKISSLFNNNVLNDNPCKYIFQYLKLADKYLISDNKLDEDELFKNIAISTKI